MVSKAHLMAFTAGDQWLAEGANLILIGPPGGGKSHLSAAIGLALVVLERRCSRNARVLDRTCG